jgi:hypothetical protein
MFACEHGMACPADVPLTCPVGLDPFLDGLCTAIEAGQATEIAAMENWLAAKSLTNTTSCEGSATPLEMMGMQMGCGDGTCSSTTAFMHENMAMHDGMAIEFTCDVEVDFLRGMIPHHAGAITMCAIMRANFDGGMNSTGGMDMGSGGGMDMGMGRRRAQMDMGGAQCNDGVEEGCTSTLVATPNTVVVGDTATCTLTAADADATPAVVGSCVAADPAVATCGYVAPVASTVEAAEEACQATNGCACEDDETSGCDDFFRTVFNQTSDSLIAAAGGSCRVALST